MEVSFVTSVVNVRDALDKKVERMLFNEEVCSEGSSLEIDPLGTS